MEKRCKKCPIEISISSYKLIFVFIFPIIDIFQNKIRQKYVKTNTEYFKTLSYYLSYLFSFIFLILKKILYPNEKIQVKEDEEEEEIEEEKKEEEKKEDEKKEGNKIDESDDSEINISKNKVNKTLGSSILKEIKKKKWRKYVLIIILNMKVILIKEL
jgi:flagellar biosynthesis/type III secretory pathway M-ring protein FliF/YscJ